MLEQPWVEDLVVLHASTGGKLGTEVVEWPSRTVDALEIIRGTLAAEAKREEESRQKSGGTQ